MEQESPSKDTPVGKLVKRFIYPDGRLTAVITVDGDWKTEVFPTVEAAERFARENNLAIEEMRADE